jgi:hypothetical protein
MWMSNVAAAALMLAALRPVVDGDASPSGSLRRPLLLAIALAADVGGIATPVGTGSNGIAMAALASTHPISFVQWMCFGVPLAFGLLAAALAVVVWRVRPAGVVALPAAAPSRMSAAAWRLAVVFGATVLLWLTEPLHGVRAWVVALGAVGALVLVGLLGWRDVRRMDWSTLLLIAGGIALGALLDASGLVRVGAAYVPLAGAPPFVRLLALCLASAGLSAVIGNTATAALLVPLAWRSTRRRRSTPRRRPPSASRYRRRSGCRSSSARRRTPWRSGRASCARASCRCPGSSSCSAAACWSRSPGRPSCARSGSRRAASPACPSPACPSPACPSPACPSPACPSPACPSPGRVPVARPRSRASPRRAPGGAPPCASARVHRVRTREAHRRVARLHRPRRARGRQPPGVRRRSAAVRAPGAAPPGACRAGFPVGSIGRVV